MSAGGAESTRELLSIDVAAELLSKDPGQIVVSVDDGSRAQDFMCPRQPRVVLPQRQVDTAVERPEARKSQEREGDGAEHGRSVARGSNDRSSAMDSRMSSRARWLGRWLSRRRSASVPRRQFGTSSRNSRRAKARVSTDRWASVGRPCPLRAWLRNEMSKRML